MLYSELYLESGGKSGLETKSSNAYPDTPYYSVWRCRTGSICWESVWTTGGGSHTHALCCLSIGHSPISQPVSGVLLKSGAVHELPATGSEEIRLQIGRKLLEMHDNSRSPQFPRATSVASSH